MAGSAGSIYVDMLLRDAAYIESLARAQKKTSSFASSATGSLRGMKASFVSVLNPVQNLSATLQNLGGVLAASLSIDKIVKYSDSWRQLTGRLGLVSTGMGDVALKQDALFEIAQRTRQPLEDITNFYTRLNQFIPETERAQYDLLGVTESVSAAIAITGESSISAQAALIQFTQGIGTNFEAAGQEIRSLQELAPRLTQALQNALGNGEQSLQQLVKAGLVTRKSVLDALSGMGVEGRKLSDELGKVPVTVAQAFTRLDNAFLSYIGNAKDVTTATSSVAMAVSWLADNFGVLGDSIEALAMGAGFATLVKLGTTISGIVSAGYAGFMALAGGGGLSAGLIAVSLYAEAAGVALLGMVASAGPIAIVAAGILALAFNTDEGAKAEKEYHKQIIATQKEYAKYISLSQEQKKAVDEANKARMTAANNDIAATTALVVQYYNLSAAQKMFYDMKAGLGIETSINEFIKKIAEAQGAVNQFAIAERDKNKPKKTTTETSADKLKKQQSEAESFYKKYESIITGTSEAQIEYNRVIAEADNALKMHVITNEEYNRIKEEQTNILNGNNDTQKSMQSIYKKYESELTGLTKETLQYNEAQAELNKLVAAGWPQAEIDDALARYKESLDKNKGFLSEWAVDSAETAKEAARNIHDVFADFLFDPFKDGVDGMLESFTNMLRKMVANIVASNILTYVAQIASISESGGASGGSGIISSIVGAVGSLFGGAAATGSPMALAGSEATFGGLYASGGYIKPGEWGITGESGAEITYGGKTGVTVIPGGESDVGSAVASGSGVMGVTVNIINNSKSGVSTSSKKGNDGLSLEVLIDEAVAKNVVTSGSKTFQALGAYSGRTLARR